MAAVDVVDLFAVVATAFWMVRVDREKNGYQRNQKLVSLVTTLLGLLLLVLIVRDSCYRESNTELPEKNGPRGGAASGGLYLQATRASAQAPGR